MILSLAAHIRGCKFNPKNKEINVSTNVENTDEEPSAASTQNIVVETLPSVVTEVSDKLKKTKKSK